YDTFRAAHEGDFSPLIKLLRDGCELNADRRNLIITILEGKVGKKPSHRRSTRKTLKRQSDIAAKVRELEDKGWKTTAAVKQAQSEFDCSDTTVRDALKRDDLARLFLSNPPPGLSEHGSQVFLCSLEMVMCDMVAKVGLTPDPLDYPKEVIAEALRMF